ncbi:1-acyl-sn-glycerol-3-phosphate acyltransferase [Paenarthrobacter sp. DKR-5]|uniref:lysophospholipid acyltransferase family protein n=1 Tax=Paenarthrobacter sp. DKR-5 TaxID=2835535 RepID=UPI001BDC0F9C|nr:lysophospholipid acyltransferase family protein [Paenarthrobacter sp. DKR-5]MBT1002611.1 1-acyl-sn-glycerol-3-phosphate acyltransferase [Paenarthrobacter sp. DKR-5]
MAWRPPQNNTFYRCLIRTGMILRGLFRIAILSSGEEHLPAPDPTDGRQRVPVPGRGAVVAITHFGYLDFAVTELVFWRCLRAHLRFLITKAAADHWLTGAAVTAAGHVEVDRADGSGAYRHAVQKLCAGEFVAVLPEAGVSRSFTVRECKTGAVRMAAEAQVPLIPVSVWGSHRLMSRGHPFSLRRSWRAPVRVHIGPPQHYPADVDAAAATADLRALLQEGIDAGMADFPLRPEPGAWWMPAALGGGAVTVEEQARLDAEDARRFASRHHGRAAARGAGAE